MQASSNKLGIWLVSFFLTLHWFDIKASGETQTPEAFHSLYQDRFSSREAGCYEDDGYIFVISTVEISTPVSNQSLNRAKAKALLDNNRYLKLHLQGTEKSPYKPLDESSLLFKFPDFRMFLERHIPQLFEVPMNLMAKGIQLENTISGGILRYAYGYKVEDITSNLLVDVDWPSNSKLLLATREWMRTRSKSFVNSEEHREILNQLGMQIDLFSSALDDLSVNYGFNLSNDWHLQLEDSFEIYERHRKVDTLLSLNDGTWQLDEFSQVFNLLPFYPPSTAKFLDILSAQTSEVHLHAASLLALRPIEDTFGSIIHEKGMTSKTVKPQHAKQEFAHLHWLIDARLGASLPQYLNFPLFIHNSRTFGLGVISSIKENTLSADYTKAYDLFKQGRQLSLIRELLIASVVDDPHHSEYWNLLGRVLELEDHPLLAIPCYHRAVRLGGGSLVRANLAKVYHTTGHVALAQCMALSVLLHADVGDWETKVASDMLNISF